MSLFTITSIDTKPVVKELHRLNDLLELIIRLQYDYHVTPLKAVPSDTTEPDSVSYASDAELAKQEMIDEVRRFQHVADEIEKEEAD